MLLIYKYAIDISDIPWGEALKGRRLEKPTESGQDIFFSALSTFRESAEGPGCLVAVQCTEKGQAGGKHISLPSPPCLGCPEFPSCLTRLRIKTENK